MVAIIVDDEVLAVEHLSRLLSKAGFKVYCFTNPLEALTAEEIQNADVFYLDIEMPEMTGIVLAGKVRDINTDCEVVFITGHNEYALEAFDVNAIDYLLKPVTPRQVERSVERIIKRKGGKVLINEDKAAVKNRVNVSLFGKTSVYIGDGNKSIKFMTAKVTEVFCFMLLQKKGTEISKWKLIDEIWPDKDVNKGDINMRSTISRLNKTFRENGIQIIMKSTRNSYRLEISEEVEVDAFFLKSIADSSYIISEDNLLSYEKTIIKYNDTLLEEFDSEWCDIYRTLYHRYFKMAAQKLIDYYRLVQQDPFRILNIIERFIRYEPYDDEIRELALRLYYHSYGKFEAIKYYEKYSKLLKEELDIQPGEKLKYCYQTLMQDS